MKKAGKEPINAPHTSACGCILISKAWLSTGWLTQVFILMGQFRGALEEPPSRPFGLESVSRDGLLPRLVAAPKCFHRQKVSFPPTHFLTPLTSNEVWPYRHWNTKYARQRANCLKADPNGGATAWKLTVSARCTPTDKRSRLKRKEIHMFTITILCCIRKKNSKDVQNGWPSKCCSSSTNNPGFLIEITKGNIWKKAALIS